MDGFTVKLLRNISIKGQLKSGHFSRVPNESFHKKYFVKRKQDTIKK